MEFIIIIGIILWFLWLCGAFDGNSSSNKTHSSHPTSFGNNNRSSTYSYHPPIAKKPYVNTDQLRAQFEQLKATEQFKEWRKAQYYCQDGKCAWCKCKLDLHSPYTQVDHLKPLCQGGSPTDYDNFVLACKTCNYWCKKGNYTWRDKNGTVHNGWSKPAWIKENPVTTKDTDNYTESEIYDLSDIPF